MDSLKSQSAEWFRDAKFGVWAHLGSRRPCPWTVIGTTTAGIYEQGSGDSGPHRGGSGHPSVFGYKDIIPLWKAEKWDSDRLMQLYKKAGAKYS